MEQRYVSKPQEVEAIQWTTEGDGDLRERVHNLDELEEFFPGGVRLSNDGAGPLFMLAGAGGAQDWVPVPEGHWIVRPAGDRTDHWPVDPDYFSAKYDPAQNDGSEVE